MKNLEELEKKYEELGKEIERLKNEKKNGRWRAKRGKFYFYFDSFGKIIKELDLRTDYDIFRYLTGNYFKSQEQAEKVKEKLLIYMQLKDLALRLNNGRKIDWNDGTQCKYFIFFDYSSKKLDTTALSTNRDMAVIYCLDNLFLDKAIEEIGKGNLLKLFREEN